MEIPGLKEFRLPGITEESVTEEQFNELMTKLSKVSFQLQEINDTLDGRVLSANIHNESIQTRHLEAESITTAKLAAGEIILATIAEDFNWSTLADDGNKPDDNADVTGDNTAADIINLPATPSTAGLYASGTYLGYHDGTDWKAYIQNDGKFYFTGDANNYVQWNSTSLTIKGTITLLNTIDWQTNVAGTGKPDDNADVTLAAIQGELSLAGGGLVLASAGAKIRGGQTAYATGTGFWLGDDSGTFKFSIGSSTIYMRWTGAALEIAGIVSADALSVLNADLGTITAGNITLNTSGFIRTSGKDNYADTTAGIFFGYDGGAYKLNIGSSTKYIKWDGSVLTIRGTLNADDLTAGTLSVNRIATGSITATQLTGTTLSALYANLGTITAGTISGVRFNVGGGTDEDIYFADSTIRMYDAHNADYKQIKFKYSTLDFAKLTYYTADNVTTLTLFSTTNEILIEQIGSIQGYIRTDSSCLKLGAIAGDIKVWSTGQLGLEALGSDPSSNLAAGQLAVVNNVLRIYDGANWANV